MTKEPKLQAAVRIVAEWTDYDQEIKRLQSRVQESADRTTKDQSTSTAGRQVKYNHQNGQWVRFSYVPSDVHTELWAIAGSRWALFKESGRRQWWSFSANWGAQSTSHSWTTV